MAVIALFLTRQPGIAALIALKTLPVVQGQGIAALIALKILDGVSPKISDETMDYDDPTRAHLLIEAVRMGFADAREYVADLDHMVVPPESLLTEEYAAARRALLIEGRTMMTK